MDLHASLAAVSVRSMGDARKAAEAMRDAIGAGTYHPFTGPINKQDGSAWLAEGAVAPDGDLLGMNFYVEGITGDIPQ